MSPLQNAWEYLAHLVWLTRPEAVRELPVERQREWYRATLQELADEMKR